MNGNERISRRGFVARLGLAAGGTWAVSRGVRWLKPDTAGAEAPESLSVVHLSDIHWGYQGDYNRHLAKSLEDTLSRVRALSPRPEIMVVTGDLIETTTSDATRLERLKEVRGLLDAVKIPWRAVPGEHDALWDRGRAFREVVGPLYQTFRVGSTRFLALDNVSQGFFLDQGEMDWLRRTVAGWSTETSVVVLSHAPLYDVFIPWNWYTLNGAEVYATLRRFSRLSLLFGHVHQAIQHTHQGRMNASGLPTSWPWPEPNGMVQLEGWPQGASHPEMGLGFRRVMVDGSGHLKVQSELLEPGATAR